MSARLGPEWRALVEALGEFAAATFTCDTDRAEESCTALSKACRDLLAADRAGPLNPAPGVAEVAAFERSVRRRAEEMIFEPASPALAAQCADCGLPYGGLGWMDVVLPQDIWTRISPDGEGNGLLCITCMARRCQQQGLTCPVRITSGPFGLWHDSARDGLLAPGNVASPAPADPAGESQTLTRLLDELYELGVEAGHERSGWTPNDQRNHAAAAQTVESAIHAEVQRREAAAREEAKAAIREDAESLAVQAFARHVTLHDPEAATHMERIDEETFVLAMEAALRAVAPEGPLTRSQPHE